MDIDNNKVLICNCENTMEIDGEAISKACSSASKCDVYDNLCGTQLDLVLEQLKTTKENNKNLFK